MRNIARNFVMALGAVFILIGILGFIPGLTPDDELFGLFAVSTAHNLVHLVSGLAAVAAASMGEDSSRLFAKVFGVVYGVVTILGFIQGDGANVLGFIDVNQPDNVLHLVIAAYLLYVGFGADPATARPRAAA